MAHFHYYASLSSTMDEARTHALNNAEESTIIVSAQQTAGRGRRGRSWESLPGNIYFTYITYQSCTLLKAPQLSFVACVAVGEVLRSFLSPPHTLLYKWPNDLLLNGKKVAGILLETLSIPNKKEIAYLIGCGINLVTSPLEARYSPTSFQEEGVSLSYDGTLQKIARSLQDSIQLWQSEGFVPVRRAWMNFSMGLGNVLSFDVDNQRLEGVSQGIDEEGALVLETPQGILKLRAGEVLRSF